MTSGARSTKKAPKAARVRGDGLRPYGAAMDVLGNSEKQDIGRWADNRVEIVTCLVGDEKGPC